jgi:hypothetical protein
MLLLLGLTASGMYGARIVSFSLPADTAQVFDINNQNAVVGSLLGAAAPEGFIRAPNGRIQRFTAGSAPTAATAINDAGAVAGTVFGQAGPQGFIRSADGLFYDFFSIPGSQGINVTGINNLGQVSGTFFAGSQLPGTFSQYGFVRNADGSIATYQLPGLPTTVTGINDDGELSGFYLATSIIPPPNPGDPPNFRTDPYGFVRQADGEYELFSMGGAPAVPEDINNSGDTVGSSPSPMGTSNVFIRRASGAFSFISIPGSDFRTANGINDRLNVAGIYRSQGLTRGYIAFWDAPLSTSAAIVATPEPSSAMLVCIGVLLAAARRFRRVRAR